MELVTAVFLIKIIQTTYFGINLLTITTMKKIIVSLVITNIITLGLLWYNNKNSVSIDEYNEVKKELEITNDVVMWVEEVLDDPYIEDYLNSEEREKWAKYH